MKIPKKIKVGGHIIKIKIGEIKGDLCGQFSTTQNTIEIDKELAQSQKESTLIHEALHAMNATLGETHMSHVVLDSLAEQIYQFLVDNKFLK